MKKLVFVAAALASGALMAVESANTFVTIKATSATTNTVIAVPLVAVGSGNAAVNVTNFVLTTGLTPGAYLLYKSGDNWYSFVNTAGTWTSATVSEKDTTTTAATTDTFARGQAVLLHNEFEGSSFNFYLYGQQATVASSPVSVTAGTPAAPAYTLVANGSLSDFKVSSATWTGVQSGDQIGIPASSGVGMTFYKAVTNDGASWTKVDGLAQVAVTDSDKIPVGTGFWYVSKGGTPSITWAAE